VTEQLEALGERINELEAKAHAFTPEQMARAGVIVSLSSDGEPEVHRGLIRPEDAEAVSEAEEDADEERPSAPSLPATPIAALTERRTAARPRSTWGGHDCKGAGATTVILERTLPQEEVQARLAAVVENIHIVTCPIRSRHYR
jgi:hypothetical protein